MSINRMIFHLTNVAYKRAVKPDYRRLREVSVKLEKQCNELKLNDDWMVLLMIMFQRGILSFGRNKFIFWSWFVIQNVNFLVFNNWIQLYEKLTTKSILWFLLKLKWERRGYAKPRCGGWNAFQHFTSVLTVIFSEEIYLGKKTFNTFEFVHIEVSGNPYDSCIRAFKVEAIQKNYELLQFVYGFKNVWVMTKWSPKHLTLEIPYRFPRKCYFDAARWKDLIKIF